MTGALLVLSDLQCEKVSSMAIVGMVHSLTEKVQTQALIVWYMKVV